LNREDFKENLKIAALLIGLFVIIFTPIAIAGYFAWQGSITWDIEEAEVKEFTVWDSLTDGSEVFTNWQEPLGTIPQAQLPYLYEKTFYLQNDGNVEFTVIVSETLETGCVGEWSNSGSYTLAVGSARVQATLTLTITEDGGYNFEFTISP
jgi:hypothetical protein